MASEDPKLVTLNFLDSDSKLILNRIYDKLECLDQKMSFVTEFLLQKMAKDEGEPPRKIPRPASQDPNQITNVHPPFVTEFLLQKMAKDKGEPPRKIPRPTSQDPNQIINV